MDTLNLSTIKPLNIDKNNNVYVISFPPENKMKTTAIILATLADMFINNSVDFKRDLKPYNVVYFTDDNIQEVSNLFDEIVIARHNKGTQGTVKSTITFMNNSKEVEEIYVDCREMYIQKQEANTPITLFVFDIPSIGLRILPYVHRLEKEFGIWSIVVAPQTRVTREVVKRRFSPKK